MQTTSHPCCALSLVPGDTRFSPFPADTNGAHPDRDEVTQALNILLALKRWIRVQVPTIEDGNNFGVSVQREVAGAIDELLEPMQKALDKLPGYFEKRASAWDKIATKISKETKKSNSTAKETGGKV